MLLKRDVKAKRNIKDLIREGARLSLIR